MAEYIHTSDRGRTDISSREEDVLRALSNPIGLKLFKLIATNTTSTDSSQVITSDFLNSQTKVTRKQCFCLQHGIDSNCGWNFGTFFGRRNIWLASNASWLSYGYELCNNCRQFNIAWEIYPTICAYQTKKRRNLYR